jgi:hypothetical protein
MTCGKDKPVSVTTHCRKARVSKKTVAGPTKKQSYQKAKRKRKRKTKVKPLNSGDVNRMKSAVN